MLGAKMMKVHKMSDERWTMKDKLHQYRGILRLYDRDKKLRSLELVKLKDRVKKNLKTLQIDVRQYRTIITDIIKGDKLRLQNILHRHRRFNLAYIRFDTEEIHAAIYEQGDLKRRELDRLRHEKEQKVQKFLDLQVEQCWLTNEKENKNETNTITQHLAAEYQRALAKRNAAKAIRATYTTIMNILKKDAVYFDALLRALRDDQTDQCRLILNATIIGQLAAENVDDLKNKYKQMTKDVLVNMKEREQTLVAAREQVKDLWDYARSLVRAESVPGFTKEERKSEFGSLEKQLQQLETIFDMLKETVLVRTYNELFPRLEEQAKQRTRLIAQFNHNVKERDDYLSKKELALVTLEGLEHSMVSTTGQYRIDKKAMLTEIEAQKKLEVEYKEMRRSNGELMMKIRAALQNMLLMLICIKRGGRARRKGDKKGKKEQEVEAEETDGPILEKVESDGLILLAHVSRKMGTLFGMSSYELDPERNERAKNLYQTYVAGYQTQLKYTSIPEATALVVEHEITDPTVLTRADIKLRSKQLVEANLKPE